jgi:hypothetical protein
LSEKAFEVYHVGETEADVREGQDFPRLWATWHYDWSVPGMVKLTVVASDALAPGGYMTMTPTQTDRGGSSVHAVWEQTSTSVRGLLGVAMMRVIGRRFLATYYKKAYDGMAG